MPCSIRTYGSFSFASFTPKTAAILIFSCFAHRMGRKPVVSHGKCRAYRNNDGIYYICLPVNALRYDKRQTAAFAVSRLYRRSYGNHAWPTAQRLFTSCWRPPPRNPCSAGKVDWLVAYAVRVPPGPGLSGNQLRGGVRAGGVEGGVAGLHRTEDLAWCWRLFGPAVKNGHKMCRTTRALAWAENAPPWGLMPAADQPIKRRRSSLLTDPALALNSPSPSALAVLATRISP